jgi:NiFe hydrogenase small subunit HydA
MSISRRDFLKYCSATAAALGLGGADLLRLEQVLANPASPTVLWLHGSSCSGCSVSFLNYIATTDPTDAGDLLLNHINLAYHPVLMAAAGLPAFQAAEAAYAQGGYVLVVEGAVATQFGGRCCWPWSNASNVEETFQAVVTKYAGKAAKIVCAGTCSAFGGIPASGGNPTLAKSVKDATGKSTINIPGCPSHPDWLVWAIVQILLNKPITLDSYGRPTTLFGQTVHSNCPRRNNPERCLAPKGCRGPGTKANCPTNLWNNWTNWCIDANAPCYACTEPTFPGNDSFYTAVYNHTGGTNLNCGSCHGDDD